MPRYGKVISASISIDEKLLAIGFLVSSEKIVEVPHIVFPDHHLHYFPSNDTVSPVVQFKTILVEPSAHVFGCYAVHFDNMRDPFDTISRTSHQNRKRTHFNVRPRVITRITKDWVHKGVHEKLGFIFCPNALDRS